MRKHTIGIIGLALVVVAGCTTATITKGVTENGETRAATPVERYTAALLDLDDLYDSAILYGSQPRCAPPAIVVACHDPEALRRMRDALAVADDSLDALFLIFASENPSPTSDDVLKLQLAVAGLSAVQSFLAQQLNSVGG